MQGKQGHYCYSHVAINNVAPLHLFRGPREAGFSELMSKKWGCVVKVSWFYFNRSHSEALYIGRLSVSLLVEVVVYMGLNNESRRDCNINTSNSLCTHSNS